MSDEAVILIAEDRDDDVLLIRRAFEMGGVLNPIHVVKNGEEAIEYLKGEGRYANRSEYPLPALMLLDLKMPRTDGFEVLSWIRAEPSLSNLRVIVLTSSSDMRDVTLAYDLGANSFLVKPMDFKNFVEMSRFLKDHWLRSSREPTISRPRREQRVEEKGGLGQ
jgi:CheY-like chemotaxis protein